MFGKRNKNESNNNQSSLFSSFDNLQYYSVQNATNEEMFKICDMILSRKPVLANFDKAPSNEMLAFIAGVVYAEDGEIFRLFECSFLFGVKEVYEDGSLYQYIKDQQI